MFSYLMTTLLALALPAAVIGWKVRDNLNHVAYWTSIAVVALLGAMWSAVLQAQGWWSFGLETRTGLMIGEHLVLEEAVFYPCAGALCLSLYGLGTRSGSRSIGVAYVGAVWGGSFAVLALVLALWDSRPYYLLSQLVLYNVIVAVPLSGVASRRASATGLLVAVGGMALIGIGWDLAAYGSWWTYHANTGIFLGGVPLDDVNFFLFAPAAAVSVYVGVVSVLERRRLPRAAPCLSADLKVSGARWNRASTAAAQEIR